MAGARRVQCSQLGSIRKLGSAVRCPAVPACDADSHPESLHEAEDPHGFGQARVAVVGDPRLAEVLRGDRSVGTTWTHDLDAVVKPADADR